jgi:hypothetical protein
MPMRRLFSCDGCDVYGDLTDEVDCAPFAPHAEDAANIARTTADVVATATTATPAATPNASALPPLPDPAPSASAVVASTKEHESSSKDLTPPPPKKTVKISDAIAAGAAEEAPDATETEAEKQPTRGATPETARGRDASTTAGASPHPTTPSAAVHASDHDTHVAATVAEEHATPPQLQPQPHAAESGGRVVATTAGAVTETESVADPAPPPSSGGSSSGDLPLVHERQLSSFQPISGGDRVSGAGLRTSDMEVRVDAELESPDASLLIHDYVATAMALSHVGEHGCFEVALDVRRGVPAAGLTFRPGPDGRPQVSAVDPKPKTLNTYNHKPACAKRARSPRTATRPPAPRGSAPAPPAPHGSAP